MAQYQYRYSRHKTISQTPVTDSDSTSSHWQDDLRDSSIYIFPSPPSAPPSPSAYSDFSLHTEASSFSQFSSDSPSQEPSLAPSPLLLNVNDLTSRHSRIEVGKLRDVLFEPSWEWPSNLDAHAAPTVTGAGPSEAADASTLGRGRHNIGGSNSSSRQTLIGVGALRTSSWNLAALTNRRLDAACRPPERPRETPRLYIPLLSFFISLLSADDSTYDLLTTASSASIFANHAKTITPGSTSYENDPKDPEEELHGVDKLFFTIDSENRPSFYRREEGLGEAPIPISLSDVWSLFSGFVSNGGKAIHDIFQ